MTVGQHAAPTFRRTPAISASPPLALVPAASTRPHRTPFVLLVVALLGTGLVGLLLLNTTLAQGSFRLHDLQRQTAALQDQEQQLQIAVDDAATPQRLSRAAHRLGLVPAQDPGFLRLRDGKILGEPRAASARPVARVSARPSPAAGAATVTTPKPGTKTQGKPSTVSSQRHKPATQPRSKPSPATGAHPTRAPSPRPSGHR